MDFADEALLDFFKILNANNVRYIMIKVPFLHINHLIQNKKAVNRLKDQLDVIYLEKIKQILDEEEQKKNKE